MLRQRVGIGSLPLLPSLRRPASSQIPNLSVKPMAGAGEDAGNDPKELAIQAENGKTSSNTFRILKEELRYSRYLNVYNRIVEYPKDEQQNAVATAVEYDIVGSKTVSFHFCAIMPFNTSSKSVTLIKEYAQGANAMLYSVPCGGVSKTHVSLEDCALKELSEVAHLHNGKLVKLIGDDHPGLLEVKWCRNRFTPFLVLDPEVDPNPRPRDKEEFIEILTVDLPKLKDMMYSGHMMLPSIVTCAMALRYLEEHDLV